MAAITDDRLTRCERAGNSVIFTNPSPAERDAIALHFGALKTQGHAIQAEEVADHDHVNVEIRVHHYKTCGVCNHAR